MSFRTPCKNTSFSKTIVKLDYFHFRPSGRAYLKLSNARFMDSVIPILRRCTFASSRIVANPSPTPSHISMRSRGKKGRAEAEERGVIVGNGAAGGLHVKGCDVMISGLPSRSSSEQMTRYLKRNRLVGETDDGFADCEILQVRVYVKFSFVTSCSCTEFSFYFVCRGRMESFTQQFLVRLRTAAEAHALVRRLHLTYCQLASDHGMPVLIRAHVLY